MVSGEMPIEHGDSWFSAKFIEVRHPSKSGRVYIYVIYGFSSGTGAGRVLFAIILVELYSIMENLANGVIFFLGSQTVGDKVHKSKR